MMRPQRRTRLPLAVRASTLVTVIASVAVGGVRAQEGQALTGTVVDAAGRPIGAVLVFIDSSDARTETDETGGFRLSGVRPGRVRLSLRREGYAPRSFEIEVPRTPSGALPVGTIALVPGPLPDAVLSGRVTDAQTGAALLGVGIAVNGNIVGFSRRDGSFRIDRMLMHWGGNQVGVRRIGYHPLFTDVDVTNQETEFQLDITLHPLPIVLPEVVVEEDRATFEFGRMREFYRRRRQGRGVFITRVDIERRGPTEVTDLLTGIPGVFVTPDARGRNSISFSGGAFANCAPRVWVDGFPLSLDLAFDNINQYVGPDNVAGVEVYRRASEVPAEFSGGPGSGSCGALIIWTH